MSIKYGYDIDLKSDSTAAKVVKLVGEGKRVLEFGCSYGYMSKVLRDEFQCVVTGVEIDPEAGKQAREFCDKVIIGNAESIIWENELGNKKFDVIIFADVLEHLVNPWRVLRDIRKYLNDNGYIVASIPNVSYLAVIIELMEGKFDYRSLGILDDTHLRFFTKDNIIHMFEETGYYIDLIQRTKIPMSVSEFKIPNQCINEELMSYITNKNQEWDTYQFITKSYKCSENSKIEVLNKEIESLKKQLCEKKLIEQENKELKLYAKKVEQDIESVNQYARKLERDIQEVTQYSNKLEKDIQEVTQYSNKLEKDIQETSQYTRKLEKDIEEINKNTDCLEKSLLDANKHVIVLEKGIEEVRNYSAQLEIEKQFLSKELEEKATIVNELEKNRIRSILNKIKNRIRL